MFVEEDQLSINLRSRIDQPLPLTDITPYGSLL